MLLLDLPPGTGDVQLAVCQELQLSGAVAVTTPSKLAAEDTRKGIEMFTSMGVPTLAVVENMSYFTCEGGTTHYPFGKGLEDLPVAEKHKIPSENIVRLPISTLTNDSNDNGSPLCVNRPDDAKDELWAFEQLARVVSKELFLLRYRVSEQLGLINIDGVDFEVEGIGCSIDKGKDTFIVRLFSDSGAKQVRIPPTQLRGRDPKNGEFLSNHVNSGDQSQHTKPGDDMVTVYKATQTKKDQTKKDPSFIPTSIEQKGRYGFAVEWGDGATIIYSMQTIARAAKYVSERQQN